MGITTLASRYRLPNALETPTCEWEQPAPQAPVSPSQRLHALLDDAQQAEADRRAVAPEPSATPASLKALLNDDAAPEALPASVESAPVVPSSQTAGQPVTFTLSCLCLGGRWLSLHGGTLTTEQRRLLVNIYRAAGIPSSAVSSWQTFTWPPLADAPAAEEPLIEAREGLEAFIGGTSSRNSWALSQLLWWADEQAPPLGDVLDVQQEQGATLSKTLALPLWQGPGLEALLHDGAAKRALWPALQALGNRWCEEQDNG